MRLRCGDFQPTFRDVLPVTGFAPATFWSQAGHSDLRHPPHLSRHRGQRGDNSSWLSQGLACWTAPESHHVCANKPEWVNIAEITCSQVKRLAHNNTFAMVTTVHPSMFHPSISHKYMFYWLQIMWWACVWGASSWYALMLRLTQAPCAAALTCLCNSQPRETHLHEEEEECACVWVCF